MKKQYLLTLVYLISMHFVIAQTIEIHSIIADREPSGDNGYTLDGIHMNSSSTEKLLNTDLFGTIHNKTVNITHSYGTGGALELIGFTPDIDLFVFGTFNKSNPDFIPFSEAEIDSVYTWSKAGGKMIIGGSVAIAAANFDPSNLNERWGFDIAQSDPFVPFIPTDEGSHSSVFDGLFGMVTSAMPAFQGGGAQGYFSTIPEGAVVLSEDDQGNPTLILDCNTLDLIIADFDGYTDLGGVTNGNTLSSPNDIFWVNSIAYMDELQDPPSISLDGEILSTGNYNGYQWYVNGEIIMGADQQSYTPLEEGNYSVVVDMECGCTYQSEEMAFTVTNIEDLILDGAVSISPNPAIDELNIAFTLIVNSEVQLTIYNSLGQQMPSSQQFLDLTMGSHQLNIETEALAAGIYSLSLSTEKGIKAIQFVKQ